MNAPVSFRFELGSDPRPLIAPTPDTASVLITGGAQRIGAAIARDLAARGWAVAIHHNASGEAAAALCDQIRGAGGTAEPIQADLSCHQQAQDLVTRAATRLGPIGVLINNASIFEWDDIETLDEVSLARHMDTNLRAPLMLCREFAAALLHRHGGSIINMLDSRVLNPTPRYLAYTLSKTSLWTATRTLAHALAPRIRVNGIGPGPTLPQRGQTPDQFERRCARLPLRRPASLDEICEAVRFLISMQSLTGQVIALDGGDHLVGQCDRA